MPNEFADAPVRSPYEASTRDNGRNLANDNQRGYTLQDVEHAARDTAAAFLPVIGILGQDSVAHLNPVDPRSSEIARDAANANRQMPGLMDKAGARAQGRDGLTRADLDKLERDRTLNADQRSAVRYLKDNYDALQTERAWDVAGMGGAASWLFGSSRITGKSLARNADASRPTGGEVPPPEDPSGQVRNRPARPSSQPDPLDRPRSGQDVVVQRGWGWEKIAERSMQQDGIPFTREAMQREIDRLQRLNPGKERMVHTYDRIKTR